MPLYLRERYTVRVFNYVNVKNRQMIHLEGTAQVDVTDPESEFTVVLQGIP